MVDEETKEKIQDCIFCKISKEDSEEKILESDNFFVIKDINPRTEGHSMVIPREHYQTLLDVPDSLLGEFLEVVKKTGFKLLKDTESKGFNLIMNNFSVSGQVVEHAHLHVVPRKDGDGFKVNV